MRNSTIKSFTAGFAVGAAFMAGLWHATGQAVAAPSAELTDEQNVYVEEYEKYICGSIFGNPTSAGVLITLKMVEADGWTPYESGMIVAQSVIDACPGQIPVVQQFIEDVKNATQAQTKVA